MRTADDGEQPAEDAEYFARWSRDALVAVGRGLRMERYINHRWRRWTQIRREEDEVWPAEDADYFAHWSGRRVK